jgi:NADP-dependent 3-hydroxy acid dehydrogenase YdfG
MDGLIINVSSWSGNHISLLSGVSYTSAKHAVNAMTETINMEFCNVGIRACALCPGEVATPILEKRPKKLSVEQKNKMLQPDDLGETIAFVCQMPKHVCVNELTISPTWHRRYIADLGIEEL